MSTYNALYFDKDFFSNRECSSQTTLFIFASGYESRSLHLLNKLAENGRLSEVRILGFTFENLSDAANRPANDSRLRELGITPVLCDGDSEKQMIYAVKAELDRLSATEKNMRVVVDYSSMPRQWYCQLFRFFSAKDHNAIESFFWYVHGSFGREEYPCVGYGDFKVFSGQPRVTRTSEAYIFGLGLDSIRTYGIWNFLDPQFTCCLVGVSSNNQDLVTRVRDLNHEILLAAEVVEEARLDDFPKLLASVVDLARKCSDLGDVCLVADGPKPLVLAMSIVPDIIGRTGVSSWHVSHVKPEGYVPMDVKAADCISGFSVRAATRTFSNGVAG